MSADVSWNVGLRIVDLHEISKQMQCKRCNSLLHLKCIQREHRVGLASILFILCSCGELNDVHTCSYVQSKDGSTVYTLNTQLHSSLMELKMDLLQVQKLLASLYIPVPYLENLDPHLNYLKQQITSSLPSPPGCEKISNTPETNVHWPNGLSTNGDLTMSETLPTEENGPQSVTGCEDDDCCTGNDELMCSLKPDIPELLCKMNNMQESKTNQERYSELALDPFQRNDTGRYNENELYLRSKKRRQQRDVAVVDHVAITTVDSPELLPLQEHKNQHKSKKVVNKKKPQTVMKKQLHLKRTNRSPSKSLLSLSAVTGTGCEKAATRTFRIQGSASLTKKPELPTDVFQDPANPTSQSKKQRRKMCDICGVYLSNCSALSRHRRLKHRDNNPQPCLVTGCGKLFARTDLLENHMNTKHSQEKPFQCFRCGKQFGTKKYMSDHIARCGQSPYRCHLCELLFKDRATRRDHIAMRHKGQIFVCHCGKVYQWRTSLAKHQRNCHKS